MPVSRLDIIYRKLLLTKFFTKGWGDPNNLKRLFEFRKLISNREFCYGLVPKNYPMTIINEERRSDCRIIDGKFKSPLAIYLPQVISSEIEEAYFQLILPLKWGHDSYKPICIHLAGTGDHYFWRRRNIMAKPLLKDGIGSLILENPYYGLRKPKAQVRSSVHYVSDIFVMGGCLILECIALLNWCRTLGLGPLGVTGISMGGHMASLAASNWPEPLVLVPCLSWSTASSVFTEGVMSESIDWDMLQKQYFSDSLYCDDLSKLCKIVDDPFACNLSRYSVAQSYEVISEIMESELKTNHVSPFEVVKMIDCVASSCSTTTKEGLSSSLESGKTAEMKRRDKEALWFMRGMMDECTHLRNFSVPVDTSLIISVCARADGYVPRGGVSRLEDIWPGSTVVYVDSGHVGAYIFYRKLFRKSIVDAFSKAKKKLPPPEPAHLQI